MATKRPVRDIAQALVAAAQAADVVSRVMSDLGAVAEAFEGDTTLSRSLSERTISIDKRRKALVSALDGAVHPYVVNALLLLQQFGPLASISAFTSIAREEAHRVADYQDVTVTSAASLTKTEIESLQRKLAATLGGIIHLRERINPSLLGGFVLEAGDWRFDGSLRGKISRLRTALTAT